MIYRAFGAANALETARRLAGIAQGRRLVLLVGLDPDLAEASGAHGLHLPERELDLGRSIRRRRPDWLLTGAAHGEAGLAAGAAAGLDAMLLSPVFASRSVSAGPPLGIERFARLARGSALPVFALGGVNASNASALIGAGAAGIAAVDGVAGG